MGEHDFGQHFACHREKGDATTVATFISVTLLRIYEDNVGIFHFCGSHLTDHQSWYAQQNIVSSAFIVDRRADISGAVIEPVLMSSL